MLRSTLRAPALTSRPTVLTSSPTPLMVLQALKPQRTTAVTIRRMIFFISGRLNTQRRECQFPKLQRAYWPISLTQFPAEVRSLPAPESAPPTVPHPDSESPTNARKRRVIFIIMIFQKPEAAWNYKAFLMAEQYSSITSQKILTPKSSSLSPPLSRVVPNTRCEGFRRPQIFRGGA